ncbi:MAG TPA: sulfur carrier protein ThiS [Anaerohalosphaeraceae bacterium]|nr:sulfur carrier protein ThiS [Anaerohalosphaeraceae bacterium]
MDKRLKINGQVRDFGDQLPPTLSELLKLLQIDQATVVAEVDGRIIPRNAFGQTELKENAVIELVRFVGGG